MSEYGTSQVRQSRNVFWKKCVIALLALYAGYAAFHIFSGLNKGCRLNTVLMTMTPVKELYLRPSLESELRQSPDGNVSGVVRSINIEILLGLTDMVLGDCARVEAVAELLNPATVETSSTSTASRSTPIQRASFDCQRESHFYEVSVKRRSTVLQYDSGANQIARTGLVLETGDHVRIAGKCEFVSATGQHFDFYEIHSPYDGYIYAHTVAATAPSALASNGVCSPCFFLGSEGTKDITANRPIELSVGRWNFSVSKSNPEMSVQLNVISEKPEGCLRVFGGIELPLKASVLHNCEIRAIVNAVNGAGNWTIQMQRQ